MSYPNILILESDLNFLEKLNRAFKSFGINTISKTDVKDPDELFDINIPIHAVVLNLELQNMEGLTLYSSLKKSNKFRSTNFSFIADSKELYCLLENMPLERSIVLNKKDDFDLLFRSILDNISFPQTEDLEQEYITEITGKLEDAPLKTILLFCKNTCFTGRIVLTHHNDFGIIDFKNGKINKSIYKEMLSEEALNLFKTWEKGEFRIERFIYTYEDLLKLTATVDNNNNNNNNISIELGDLFTDIFYFLHAFLSDQLLPFEVNNSFNKALEDIGEIYIYFKNSIYQIDEDEKIIFNFHVNDLNINPMIELFYEIFSNAKYYQPEIELEDLFDYFHELEPYLKQIRFYKILRSLSSKVNTETTYHKYN